MSFLLISVVLVTSPGKRFIAQYASPEVRTNCNSGIPLRLHISCQLLLGACSMAVFCWLCYFEGPAM